MALNFLDALLFTAFSFIFAFSRSSSKRSKSIPKHSLLIFQSSICLHNVSSLISFGNMASVPYVRLNGVSPVEVCGVHLYAHNISGNSFAHNHFALPNLLFSCPRIILFAFCPYPFVCGCSTEFVVDLIPKFA